jgi:hypothetical protein
MSSIFPRNCFATIKWYRSSRLELEDGVPCSVRIASLRARAAILTLWPEQLGSARLRVILRRRHYALDWQSDYTGWVRLFGRLYQAGLKLTSSRNEARLYLRPVDLQDLPTQLEVLAR